MSSLTRSLYMLTSWITCGAFPGTNDMWVYCILRYDWRSKLKELSKFACVRSSFFICTQEHCDYKDAVSDDFLTTYMFAKKESIWGVSVNWKAISDFQFTQRTC